MTDLFVVILVGVLMVTGAIIDGWKLKVPNWLTYPMILSGWIYWAAAGASWSLVAHSVLGAFFAGALLLAPYLIGGMGAGDVKLYAGFGAWMVPLDWFGYTQLFYAFAVSVILGGAIALAMIYFKKTVFLNIENAKEIIHDLHTSASLGEIAEKAKARKPSLQLLPYGIPLTIGSLAYVAYIVPFAVAPLAMMSWGGGM
jgi:prepilin peptidase CpaA